MRTLLALLLLAAAARAAEKVADPLAGLDARELHNRGTQRLAEGDLAGAEEALRASLGRDDDALRRRPCTTSATSVSARARKASAAARPAT